MKLNAGIITEKLQESKDFYIKVLGFGVTFENEFYILMHTPDKSGEISFLKPDHPSQRPIFQPSFGGKGVYLTIEVENVDEIYRQIKAKNIPIAFGLRDEVWGDRHFAIVDPNGVGIDIVTYAKPVE
ncbi:glyoxalase [Cytophagales bacterium RKSG123]|nr:glyoxalase [Xanthovirga aplysinae]